jgi:hypothetical protein
MPNQQVLGMLAGIENVWDCFDQMMGELKTAEDWAKPHGKDWTMADVPFHMMYTERDLVAGPIQRGRNVPATEQRVQRTLRELNDWNEAKFAARPVGQTPAESWSQWRDVREAVRQTLRSLDDSQLMSDQVWFPLTGCGWVPAMVAVTFGLGHGWGEFVAMRYHLGRSTPEPAPETTHAAVGILLSFRPMFVDR